MIGIRYLTLPAVLLLALFGLVQVVLGSNIDHRSGRQMGLEHQRWVDQL